MQFHRKIVLITGGANGIGAETAKLFAQKGASVIIADIDLEAAQKMVERLPQHGDPSHMAQAMDVTSHEEVRKVIKKIADRYHGLDILINNAGVMNKERVKTADHTLADWHHVVAVNQTGVFYCMKEGLRVMQTKRSGTIVNVASLAGLKASGFNLAYSASKFAVVGMTKSAAIEYASSGIRINAVCPGYIDTDMLRSALSDQPQMEEKILGMTPMRKFGTAAEVAQAILWLAGDDCTYLTGQTITLDGGLSL